MDKAKKAVEGLGEKGVAEVRSVDTTYSVWLSVAWGSHQQLFSSGSVLYTDRKVILAKSSSACSTLSTRNSMKYFFNLQQQYVMIPLANLK